MPRHETHVANDGEGDVERDGETHAAGATLLRLAPHDLKHAPMPHAVLDPVRDHEARVRASIAAHRDGVGNGWEDGFIIAPLRDPAKAFDATDVIVDALARELTRRCGGNLVLNRMEAAAHFSQILRETHSTPIAPSESHQVD